MKSFIWLLCLLICVHCSWSKLDEGVDVHDADDDDEPNNPNNLGGDPDLTEKGDVHDADDDVVPNKANNLGDETESPDLTKKGNVSSPTTSNTTANPNVTATTPGAPADPEKTTSATNNELPTPTTMSKSASVTTEENPDVVKTPTVRKTHTRKPTNISKIDNETFMLMWKSFIKEGRRRHLSLGEATTTKGTTTKGITTKGITTKGTTTKGTTTRGTTTKGTTTSPTPVTTRPSEQGTTTKGTTTKGTTTKGTTTKGTTTKGTTTKGTTTKGTKTKGTTTKGTKDDEEQMTGPKPANRTPGSSHFAVVFLVMIALLFGLYALYHNRQKIIAVVVEGRSAHGHGGRDRYKRLDNESIEPEARIKNSNEVYVY